MKFFKSIFLLFLKRELLDLGTLDLGTLDLVYLEQTNKVKMSPAKHPPCSPTAACLGQPSGPSCPNPERCLKRCRARRLKPCASAVSIMETRSKSNCSGCKRYGVNSYNPRSTAAERSLNEKRKRERLKEIDAMSGTRYYERYMRNKEARDERSCRQGSSHRGRSKKKMNCTIL